MLQKLNDLCYKVLHHPPYSPDLLPTDHHFFKHLNNFLQGKCFHHQQEAENVFQEFVKLRGIDFHTTGINQLISHWQNVLIVMVAILINKDGFESSYNELKFTVQTHNYFCTNLIQSLPGRSQSSFNYVDHSQICTASPCSLLFLKLLTPLENYLPNISTCLSLRHLKFNLSKRKLLTFLLC